MRAAPRAWLALVALLHAADAGAFCVYNLAADADLQATLVPATKPVAKVYRDSVGPNKESCCNPKNAECNPDRVADTGLVAFEIKARQRIPGKAPQPELLCGKPTTDPRFASRVEVPAPLRALVRFEPNPRFDRGRPEGAANSRFQLRVLSAENAPLATYTCAAAP